MRQIGELGDLENSHDKINPILATEITFSRKIGFLNKNRLDAVGNGMRFVFLIDFCTVKALYYSLEV